MLNILLTIHAIITLALVGIILIQRSSADGLAGIGGGGGNFMSGRATANILTKTTAILATLFIANSLFLAVMFNQREETRSIVDDIVADELSAPTPAVPAPAPVAPIAE